MSRNATDEQIKRAYRKLALIYHPDRNNSEDAHEVFMIIGKANEVLSNPRLRAEHDFMIDYQNVINITQEINAQHNTYQTQTNNQRSDKKYYRTNAGYTPTQHETLKHSDKPIWTKAGLFIAILGVFMFVYLIAALSFTTPINC